MSRGKILRVKRLRVATVLHHRENLFFAGLVLIFLALAGLASHLFPFPNADEIVNVVAARELIHHGRSRYSLYDDIFPRDVYAIRDVSYADSRPLFGLWLGIWTFLPASADLFRVPSLVAGTVTLFLLYAVGCSLGTRRLGLATVLVVLSQPFFWLGSCVVNDYVVLLAVCSLILWWGCASPLRPPWNHLSTGALAGIGLLAHPNMLLFFMGIVSFACVRDRDRWVKVCSLLCGGFVAGLIFATLWIDVPRFWAHQHSFAGQFVRPPFLRWPWSPFKWTQNVFQMVFYAPTYFFRHLAGWPAGVRYFWVGALAIALLPGRIFLRHRPQATLKLWLSLMSGVAGVFISLTILVPRQEALYFLILLPFLAPLTATGILETNEMFQLRSIRWLGIACLAVACLSFPVGAIYQGVHDRSFKAVLRDVRALVPRGAERVAGPNALWLGFQDRDFRDLGAVVAGRYSTLEEWNLNQWFGPWHPDVLVADDLFRRVYLGKTQSPDVLSARVGVPVTLLGTVQTDTKENSWTVFRLQWPHDSALGPAK